MNRFRSINILLLGILVFFILTLMVLIYQYFKVKKQTYHQVNLSHEVIKTKLSAHIDEFISDILFLANQLEDSDSFQSSSSPFAESSMNYLKVNHRIFQLRILNKHGLEVFKMESNHGKVRRTLDKNLQDKSSRSYFLEAIKLDRGELYISDIDLNKENGEIEVPIRPTIRILTPVSMKSSKAKFYLVINFDFSQEIKDLISLLNGHSEYTALLNGRLQFIKGFHKNQDWSFMTNKEHQRFTDTFTDPELRIISTRESGLAEFEGGEASFTTIDLNNLNLPVNSGASILFNINNRLSLVTLQVPKLIMDRAIAITKADLVYIGSLNLIITFLVLIGFMQFQGRKKLNEEIKQKNLELSSTLSSRDQIYSVISHDLRSPFTGLIGLTDVIVDEGKEMGIEEIIQMVKMVNSSAKSTFKLLDNLLNWTRLEQGALQIGFKDIHLKDVITEIETLYHLVLADKKISLETELEEGLMFKGDPEMIATCIRNVLSNAIKFTPEGGRISIRSYEEDEMIKIEISDTGKGMTEEVRQSVLQDNVVRSSSGTQGEKGHGFGLFLCKRFIEMNSGKFDLRSAIGSGTTVEFQFTKTQIFQNGIPAN